MYRKGRIAVIVEGKSRELKYMRSLQQCYFSAIEIDVLELPAEQNIYMLWKKLKDDEMETDLIEIIRESSEISAQRLKGLKRDNFMEIYLLFDFDPHQNNLGLGEGTDLDTVLRDMIETFDNETEAGKLYISYPMIEALRDMTNWSCLPYYQCEVSLTDIPNYKKLSGNQNQYADVRKYTSETWEMVTAIFLARCECLFGQNYSDGEILSWYKKKITPAVIYEQELKIFYGRQSVFILSALPEFLLDYFSESYWKNIVNSLQKISIEGCNRNDVK